MKSDVILLSDCVYLETAFMPLIETLSIMSNKDTVIWFAYCKRRKADKRFFTMVKKKFDLIEVETEQSIHYQEPYIQYYLSIDPRSPQQGNIQKREPSFLSIQKKIKCNHYTLPL